MADKVGLLTEGFKLNMEERGLIIRVLWVVTVTAFMMWILGFFAFFGMGSPFATAGDLEKSQEKTKALIEPLGAGIKSMLDSDILALEEDVDVLLARRAANPSIWTELDQRQLTRKTQLLDSKRRALAAMREAEKKGE